jgi:hypothetical protein
LAAKKSAVKYSLCRQIPANSILSIGLRQKHLEVGSVALRLSWHCQDECTQMFTAVPAFSIIKAMQMNYINYHRTIAFKSLRRHIGNA